MNRLNQKIDRFCITHPGFGISNLMKFIVIGNAAVYLLYLFTGMNFSLISFLTFDLQHVLAGEIWRVVTFLFVPDTFSPFGLLLSLYFYYFIGTSLEQRWGKGRFTIYYASGVLLSVLGVVIASLVTRNFYLGISGSSYINLSMFFAFAMLYPDAQVLLFFLIPVKMKWLAMLDGAFFLLAIFRSVAAGSLAGIILPVVALLNFTVFFWDAFSSFLGRKQARYSPQAVHFRRNVQSQPRENTEKPYHHKCCVCGRTDTDYPDLQFRYCSKCAGYHCFCQDHIFNHVHFTDENP